MSYFAPIVVLPLWLQNEQGYTPSWAGFATASFGVLGIFSSPLVGRLVDKIDLRWIVTAGLGIFAITSLLGAFNNSRVNFNRLFLERLPWGIGTACFFIPLITLAMSNIPPEKLAGLGINLDILDAHRCYLDRRPAKRGAGQVAAE
jgi:MFS transporter, DHA2 family, multidrug resistance protein